MSGFWHGTRLLSRPARMSRLVTPGLLLRWLRRRWTYRHKGGRPSVDARLAAPIGQMARENSGGHYKRIFLALTMVLVRTTSLGTQARRRQNAAAATLAA
jgi:hypothetical protein